MAVLDATASFDSDEAVEARENSESKMEVENSGGRSWAPPLLAILAIVRGRRKKTHALHNSAFLAYVKAQGGVTPRRTECKTVSSEFIPVYIYILLFFNTPPVCVKRDWSWQKKKLITDQLLESNQSPGKVLGSYKT